MIDIEQMRELRDKHFEDNCLQSLYDQVTELLNEIARLEDIIDDLRAESELE